MRIVEQIKKFAMLYGSVVIDKVIVIATSFIKNPQGQALLLQRSGKSSYPGYWQLVEGKLDENEKPAEALKREIKEEIGASVLRLELNSVMFSEIEAKGLKYLCFRIVYETRVSSKKIKISDEHISFGWFKKDEAIKLPLLPGTKEILEKITF